MRGNGSMREKYFQLFAEEDALRRSTKFHAKSRRLSYGSEIPQSGIMEVCVKSTSGRSQQSAIKSLMCIKRMRTAFAMQKWGL